MPKTKDKGKKTTSDSPGKLEPVQVMVMHTKIFDITTLLLHNLRNRKKGSDDKPRFPSIRVI